jgi:hypothetical protein
VKQFAIYDLRFTIEEKKFSTLVVRMKQFVIYDLPSGKNRRSPQPVVNRQSQIIN